MPEGDYEEKQKHLAFCLANYRLDDRQLAFLLQDRARQRYVD